MTPAELDRHRTALRAALAHVDLATPLILGAVIDGAASAELAVTLGRLASELERAIDALTTPPAR